MEENQCFPPEAGPQHFLGEVCLLLREQAILLTHYLLLRMK